MSDFPPPDAFPPPGDSAGEPYGTTPPPAVRPPPPSGPPPGYGPPAGYGPPPYYTPWAPQEARHATMALVLGIVGLASILVVCGLGLVVSPLAWYYGNSALNEIKLSNGSLGGYDSARAGQVMGIIGTVLLATILLGFVILILAVAA